MLESESIAELALVLAELESEIVLRHPRPVPVVDRPVMGRPSLKGKLAVRGGRLAVGVHDGSQGSHSFLSTENGRLQKAWQASPSQNGISVLTLPPCFDQIARTTSSVLPRSNPGGSSAAKSLAAKIPEKPSGPFDELASDRLSVAKLTTPDLLHPSDRDHPRVLPLR